MHPTLVPSENTPLLLSSNDLKGNTIYIYVAACLSAIGGFLFGYDTGIISGAMIFIRDEFDLNEWWQESIVSSTLLSAWIFSILSGSANDAFGRKPVIVISSFIFVAGSVIMAFAPDQMILLSGRLVVGAGVGLTSMTVPMYIAEIAPANIRGQLIMINMCCITGGQFIATVVAYWLSLTHGDHGWRLMLGLAAVPAGIQFITFLAMPESPRWLVSRGKDDKAREVLAKIRPKDVVVELEFEQIKHNFMQAQQEQQSLLNSDQGTLRRILGKKPVRKALLLGCLLQFVQQISGINTVMYYAASIFEMSGVYEKPKALLFAAGTGLVNFTFTIVGYTLVEKMGRRRLTLISLFGVVMSLIVLAAGFQFAYLNSPKVTNPDESPANFPCNSLNICSSCSREPNCGFCFTKSQTTGSILGATCLHVNLTHHDRSISGACHEGSNQEHIWAFEWCPSAYSWVTLLGMVLYLFFFAPGMGPMPWTINSEIYPSWARSWCLSATTSVNWLSNLLMSMTFLSLTRLITKQGAFYTYALLSSFGFLYFLVALPETGGRTLEDLEDLFAAEKPTRSDNNETNKNKEVF